MWTIGNARYSSIPDILSKLGGACRESLLGAVFAGDLWGLYLYGMFGSLSGWLQIFAFMNLFKVPRRPSKRSSQCVAREDVILVLRALLNSRCSRVR